LGSAPAEAEPLRWLEEWPRFRTEEWVFTVGTGIQAGFAKFIANEPTRNFEGGWLFDDTVRSAIRARTRDGRTIAATVSNYMYYALIACPLFDAPITATARGAGDVALQTLAINLGGFAVSGTYAIIAEKAGRARPSAVECDRDRDLGYDPRCEDKARLSHSNLSGHTSVAFAGAGLTCAHHLHLPLYGGGAPAIAACVAALSIGAAQAVLRVVSDNHYATDVILGAGYTQHCDDLRITESVQASCQSGGAVRDEGRRRAERALPGSSTRQRGAPSKA
jgi:hypothetical protein